MLQLQVLMRWWIWWHSITSMKTPKLNKRNQVNPVLLSSDICAEWFNPEFHSAKVPIKAVSVELCCTKTPNLNLILLSLLFPLLSSEVSGGGSKRNMRKCRNVVQRTTCISLAIEPRLLSRENPIPVHDLWMGHSHGSEVDELLPASHQIQHLILKNKNSESSSPCKQTNKHAVIHFLRHPNQIIPQWWLAILYTLCFHMTGKISHSLMLQRTDAGFVWVFPAMKTQTQDNKL